MATSDAPVEQATAAPGELRDLKKVSTTTEGSLTVTRYANGDVKMSFTPKGET